MSDLTMGQFFLENFQGALLSVPEPNPIIPGTIGEMIDQYDLLFCDAIRFRFITKTSLYEIINHIRTYFDKINWAHNIAIYQPLSICGDVWPEEAGTALAVLGFYEEDKGGQETNIFCFSLNPTLP